jgi:hypothetical protein
MKGTWSWPGNYRNFLQIPVVSVRVDIPNAINMALALESRCPVDIFGEYLSAIGHAVTRIKKYKPAAI